MSMTIAKINFKINFKFKNQFQTKNSQPTTSFLFQRSGLLSIIFYQKNSHILHRFTQIKILKTEHFKILRKL